jgi:hypothetical protein
MEPRHKNPNTIWKARKRNPNTDRTNACVNFNVSAWITIDRLMGHWGCTRSEVIRRLLAPILSVARTGLDEGKEAVSVSFELPLNATFWSDVARKFDWTRSSE